MDTLKKTQSLDTIVEALRQEILFGRLKPGMNLVEKEIAVKFNSSRVPVREALRILDGEGMITYKRYSGYKVKAIDPEEFMEIGIIQKLIEKELLLRAIPRYNEVTYYTIDKLLVKLKEKKDFEERYLIMIKISETLLEPANWNYSMDIIRKIMQRNIFIGRSLSMNYFEGTVPFDGHYHFLEKFIKLCKQKEVEKAVEFWCRSNDHSQIAVPLLIKDQQ